MPTPCCRIDLHYFLSFIFSSSSRPQTNFFILSFFLVSLRQLLEYYYQLFNEKLTCALGLFCLSCFKSFISIAHVGSSITRAVSLLDSIVIFVFFFILFSRKKTNETEFISNLCLSCELFSIFFHVLLILLFILNKELSYTRKNLLQISRHF